MRPIRDEYWDNLRKTLVHGDDIRVPMLFIGGWFDIYTDVVQPLKAASQAAAYRLFGTQGRDESRPCRQECPRHGLGGNFITQ